MHKLFDLKISKMLRMGVHCLTGCTMIVVVMLIVLWEQSWDIILLLCGPYVLLMLILSAYEETWSISFYSNKISKKILFFTVSEYYYTMIKDAYLNERGIVVVKFSDGRKIYIQLNYENSEKAISKIETYHSVRMQRYEL